METLTVANDIRQILGGTLVMIGAKNLGGTLNSLSFRIGGNVKRVNHIKITLNSLDLFDIEFNTIRGFKVTKTVTETGLFNDMLKDSIKRNTGFETVL